MDKMKIRDEGKDNKKRSNDIPYFKRSKRNEKRMNQIK